MPLAAFAPAKINLYLHVHGRYDDGYHALESLVAFADYGDALTLEAGKAFHLRVEGAFAHASGADEHNLVSTAAALFLKKWPQARSGAFTLTKNIPVAAGLGGGSADAAATLRLLCAVNGHDVQHIAPELALQCGADVPVCLSARSAQMRGKGEVILPVELPILYAVLVNCGTPLSTAAVFNALEMPEALAPLTVPSDLCAENLIFWLAQNTRNDLHEAALRLCPEIAQGIAVLESEGAALARLSGSGATVFGLYASDCIAAKAARAISAAQPYWWVKAVTLKNPSVSVTERVATVDRT